MNAVLPVAPLAGMSGVVFLGLSLLLGVAFGVFLEQAGFGSAKNLTSVFILRDFRVFRVMFSAVVTAAIGLQLLGAVGWLDLGLLEIDPTFLWAMLAGGVVFGVGFYVGGFCPGTAIVAMARGRWDAPAFLVGIVLGTYGFVLLYDAIGSREWFMHFYAPAGAARRTLYGAGPSWPWLAGVVAMALGGFAAVPLVEKRFALRTVAGTRPEPPVITGFWKQWGPALAVAGVVVVAGIQIVRPRRPQDSRQLPARLGNLQAPTIDGRTLAGWLLAEGHRVAEIRRGYVPNISVVDLRPPSDRTAAPLPLSLAIPRAAGPTPDIVAAIGERLRARTGWSPRRPVVLVDEDGVATGAIARGLRRQGWNAVVLSGGFAAWREGVLAPAAEWPVTVLRGEPTTTVADLRSRARAWLSGSSQELPAALVIPGTIPPERKVGTVAPRTRGGGGCG